MTTTASAPTLARGILEEIVPATATRTGYLVMSIPTSSYRIHLRPLPSPESIKVLPGKRLVGVITCEARRVDIVHTGGRLLEPVIGRPRRIHGSVVAHGESTITVNCGGGAAVDSADLPVVVKLTDPRNRPEHFPLGTLVAFDVLEGATFEAC
ncbi:MAG: hypothetical protein ACT4PL_06975 [Phycisphaerales bacterium]